MSLVSADLPDDVETLRRMVLEQALALAATKTELQQARSGLVAQALEIEKLKVQLDRLRRLQFGRSSEKLSQQIEQLELRLENLEEGLGRSEQMVPAAADPSPTDRTKPVRKPLPDHLPRDEIVHEPACACPRCGGELRRLGEDVTEVLEYTPARFHVVRHVRPKLSCRRCEAIAQAPLPDLPIERGRPGPGLLAHVLVSKYADHQPLYRQAAIFAREGVDLDRSTLADWVGRSAALLAPLAAELRRQVMASGRLHADDTPVPVLAPGLGKTRTGRLWVYVRDDRPYGGPTPPAAVYHYSPDRKGERPREHLGTFSGHLQADGYAGFDALYQPDRKPGPIIEVACWAHARRKFHDSHAANRSPTAKEALDRIGALYAIEDEIRGQPPDERRRIRQDRARLQVDDLETWLQATLPKLSGKSELARAIRYALARWTALIRYLDDGTLEIDNNAAERALRGVALGRKNYLFAGSDSGGERAAIVYSLIETAKLNGLDPQAYLADVIARINTHPAKRVAELLPWNWRRGPANLAA